MIRDWIPAPIRWFTAGLINYFKAKRKFGKLRRIFTEGPTKVIGSHLSWLSFYLRTLLVKTMSDCFFFAAINYKFIFFKFFALIRVYQSGVLIFREKSVFFSFQSPKPTNKISLIDDCKKKQMDSGRWGLSRETISLLYLRHGHFSFGIFFYLITLPIPQCIAKSSNAISSIARVSQKDGRRTPDWCIVRNFRSKTPYNNVKIKFKTYCQTCWKMSNG